MDSVHSLSVGLSFEDEMQCRKTWVRVKIVHVHFAGCNELFTWHVQGRSKQGYVSYISEKKTLSDHISNRRIKALKLTCDNKEKGCKWTWNSWNNTLQLSVGFL